MTGTSLTNSPDAEALYVALLAAMRADVTAEVLARTVMVGIHSGGVWVAERLHRDLALSGRIGTLDISFYRDDFGRIGLHPQVKPSDIPFDIEGANVFLVDDILYTGRTIRGAMNVLFDYGRPARIDLAVLIDRGRRELPVEARWCGGRIELPANEAFVLTRAAATEPTGERFTLTVEPHTRT